jgi:lysozyme family protein
MVEEDAVMETSFREAQRRCLAYEGGYSNHPKDPGGVTLNGVTQERYDQYRASKGLPQQPLTREMNGTAAWNIERDDIYRRYYWRPAGGPELNPGVDAAIYDYSVNSGHSRGVKVLQRLVGVTVDGRVGPQTIEAANKRNPQVLVGAICDERLAFLQSLKTWPTFGGGWASRVADVRKYATRLALHEPAMPSAPMNVPGKGRVPEPTGAKTGTIVAPPAAAVPIAVTFWNWITDNPVLTILVVLACAALVWGIVNRLSERRRQRQETPMPGFSAVPEEIIIPSGG